MNASDRIFSAREAIASSMHWHIDGAYAPPLPQPRPMEGPPIAPGALPGKHLILEFHEAQALTNAGLIEAGLRQATADAQATLLAFHHHIFTPDGGVTAVAVLAESHISVHTWPEVRHAALDIFMCGACDPLACLPALTQTFRPERVVLVSLTRGLGVASA